MVYRFQVFGFIEVKAESAEAARKVLTSRNGAPRAFTSFEDGVFVYSVASGNAPEAIPENERT